MCASLRRSRRRMRPRRVPDSVLAAALSGCVIEPDMLNSDRIEAQFGDYGIDVIDKIDGVRRSSLYSTTCHDNRELKICRTFSVVSIEHFEPGIVDVEHDVVMRGGSIGAIFRAHGWDVFKETLHTGSVRLQAEAQTIPALMRITGDTDLAMHVYRLLLKKSEYTLRYATIVEVHHPDYLRVGDLERTYVIDTPTAISQNELARLAELVLREA